MDEILALRHEQAQLLGFATTPSCPWHRRWPAPPTRSWPSSTTWPRARRPRPRGARRAATYARESTASTTAALGPRLLQREAAPAPSTTSPRKSSNPTSRQTARRRPACSRWSSGCSASASRSIEDVDTWHPDVRFYEIRDPDGEVRGQFYFDPYARRTSAAAPGWTSASQRIRHGAASSCRSPIWSATSPRRWTDQPSLLTHREVETLFHEFGHGLHHMLTGSTTRPWPASTACPGTRWSCPASSWRTGAGSARPWTCSPRHVETGEPIPDDLFQRMIAAKNFQSA
jgi:oligopeptidase A